MDDYTRGGHSKYSLKVHMIFVTKYRKKLFLRFTILQMETDKDHIHLLISYKSDVPIAFIVKHLKQESTYWIWKKYEVYLKSTIGNERFYGRMVTLCVV